jgi:hypothetical protein
MVLRRTASAGALFLETPNANPRKLSGPNSKLQRQGHDIFWPGVSLSGPKRADAGLGGFSGANEGASAGILPVGVGHWGVPVVALLDARGQYGMGGSGCPAVGEAGGIFYRGGAERRRFYDTVKKTL